MSGEQGPMSPYGPDVRDADGPRWQIRIAETTHRHGPFWLVWRSEHRRAQFVPSLPQVLTLEDVRALGDALHRMQTWLVAMDLHNPHPTRMAITEDEARRWAENGGRVAAPRITGDDEGLR